MADLLIRAGVLVDLDIQPDITGYNYDLAHAGYAEVEEKTTLEVAPVYDLHTPSYVEAFNPMPQSVIQVTPVYDLACQPNPVVHTEKWFLEVEPHYARPITAYCPEKVNWGLSTGRSLDLADTSNLVLEEAYQFDLDPVVDIVVNITPIKTPEVGLTVKGLRRTKMDTLSPSPESTRVLLIENTDNLRSLHEATLTIGDTHLIGVETFGSRLDMYRLDFEVFTQSDYKNRVLHKQGKQFNREALVTERMIGGATITNVTPHTDKLGTMDRLTAQIPIFPEDTLSFTKPIRLWFRIRLSQKGIGEDYAIASGWFDLIH